MKRVSSSIIVLLIIGCLVLFLTFKGAGAQVIELKLAHQWPQKEEHHVVKAAMMFEQALKQRTDGQIKIRMYPAGSLVKVMDTPEGLRSGLVNMAIFPLGYMGGILPETNAVYMPGLVGTCDAMYAYKDSEAMQFVESALNGYGIKTLLWLQYSGGIGTTKNPPITNLEHIKGRIWRSGGLLIDKNINLLGGNTLTIPSSEIYTSIQKGVLNTAFTSSSSWASFRLYEVIKNYTSPEEYGIFHGPECLLISMKTWNKLTPQHQKIMVEISAEVSKWGLEAVKNKDKDVAELFRSKGVNVVQMPKSFYEEYMTASKRVWPEIVKLVPSGGEKLLRLMEQFAATGK